ncbi:hypothetical protein HY251_16035, partial [bacterium]|nr:hypothetical protein [bacterium]
FPLNGFPENLVAGEFVGYAVWHTKQADKSGRGWHVLVSTTGKRHHFKGRIWLDGDPGSYFERIEDWKRTSEIRSELRTESWFHKGIKRRPEERPTEISFDLVSQEGNASGIHFDIVGQGTLEWQLGVGGPRDGDPVLLDSKHVRLGPENRRPPTDPFTTCVRPDHHGG